MQEIFNVVQNKINEDFLNFDNTKEIKVDKVSTPELDYESLESEIQNLINFTKKEMFVGNNYYSFFVFGDTGIGKTEIIEQMALKNDCVYHKLEIQKVPIEILQGFPYLTDINMNGKSMKLAKLAPSTILPPSDDNRTWVLHLDEFNKADTDKMAAVMNLVLTGEIGGSADYDEEKGKSVKYKLPRKTLIIGTGNTKEQKNIENLNVISSMDTATSERWHRAGYLHYNAESWLKNYALKEYKFFGHKISTRIPGIIINYILDKVLESGKNETPFIIPIVSGSEDGVEAERTTSPRAWTLVSDLMHVEMYNDFNSNKDLRKEYEEKFMDEAFAAFCKDPENQVRYLKNQIYEFGLKGNEIITDIISRYIYFANNRIIPSSIFNNYLAQRDKVKTLKEKKGMILHLLLGVAYELSEIEKVPGETKLKNWCINVSTFIEDCDIPSEDIVAFIQTVKKNKNKVSSEFNDFMIKISERYKNAYAGYYHTSINELK